MSRHCWPRRGPGSQALGRPRSVETKVTADELYNTRPQRDMAIFGILSERICIDFVMVIGKIVQGACVPLQMSNAFNRTVGGGRKHGWKRVGWNLMQEARKPFDEQKQAALRAASKVFAFFRVGYRSYT